MDKDMLDREKVVRGLMACGCDAGVPNICEVMECPYKENHGACVHLLAQDALTLLKEREEKIKSLTEDIEVWKKRYKVMVIECKSSDDPNKEPAIVKYYTTEEVEQGKAVAF